MMRTSLIALALLGTTCWTAPAHAGLFDKKPGKTSVTCLLPDGTVIHASAENGKSYIDTSICMHSAKQIVVSPHPTAQSAAATPPAAPSPAPQKSAPPKTSAAPAALPSAPKPRRLSSPVRHSVHHADGLAHWQYFNRDRAYASKQEAFAHAERDFIRAGWPAEVAKAMAEKMRTEAGEHLTLTNGDRLDFMRTGPSGLWRNVLVDFDRPTYGIGYVADATRWILTVDGVTYEAILPDVCNNLSGRKSGEETNCMIASFELRVPEERGVLYATARHHDDRCFGFRQVASFDEPEHSGTSWQKPPEGCDQDCKIETFDGRFDRPARMGTIALSPGKYQFRLSLDEYLALCVKYQEADGALSSSFVPELIPPTAAGSDYAKIAGVWRARVRYASDELPKGMTVTDPKARFFWPASQGDKDAVLQSFARR